MIVIFDGMVPKSRSLDTTKHVDDATGAGIKPAEPLLRHSLIKQLLCCCDEITHRLCAAGAADSERWRRGSNGRLCE